MCVSVYRYMHVLTAWPKKRRTVSGIEIEVLSEFLS
jgi:hypothetical protein